MIDIVQKGKGDEILRKIAQKVPLKDIGSDDIQKILKRMKKALASQDDGVALAAPQIGKSLRMFVIAGKMFKDTEDTEAPTPPDQVYINPAVVKISHKRKELNEGCLSVRHWYGKVNRSIKATVRAYDEHGKEFERGGSGLLAQIFQHEIDHLDGVLFIDKARELQDIKPEDIAERHNQYKKDEK